MMKKVLLFVTVACVALFIYSCNGGSKNKKTEDCCKKEKTEACCKEKSDSCCKEKSDSCCKGKSDSCCKGKSDACCKGKSDSCCKAKKVVITAYLEITPDKTAKFLTDVQEVITKSKAEEGNVSYNLFSDLKEKNKFVFVEEWKNRAAVETHFATEHFKKFNALMEEVGASPAKIKVFTVAGEK
jgi:quinol monooxygenase YgiN